MSPGSASARSALLRADCGLRVRGSAMAKFFGAGVLLVGAALSAGCGAARPVSYYELTVPHEKETDPPVKAFPVSLLIGPIRASHLYREDRIVYGTSTERMGTYEYERWAEAPSQMIEEVLLRELRGSGHFTAVHALQSNLSGDYLLHGRLFDFKEQTGPPLMARFAIGLELRDIKTGATVWQHYYAHDEPVAQKNLSSVVSALDQNVQRGVAEVQASLDEYFSSHTPTPDATPQ